MTEVLNVNGHILEYEEESHEYLLDGILVPSISGIARNMFPGQYAGISEAVLNRAASAGTAVHEAIEEYCRFGKESSLPELRGFKFLQKHYGFEVVSNELPVMYFKDGPFMAGRLDMIVKSGNRLGIADIKRTSSLNKDYLAYQLNLYRLAFEQTYNWKISFLAGLHLREDTRKYIEIPINEKIAFEAMEAL